MWIFADCISAMIIIIARLSVYKYEFVYKMIIANSRMT